MKKTSSARVAASCMLAGWLIAGSAAAWADARLVIQGLEIAGQTLTIEAKELDAAVRRCDEALARLGSL